MENVGLDQIGVLFYFLLGLVFLILVVLIVYVIIANRRQQAEIRNAYEADKLAPRPSLQVTGQILSLIRDEVGQALKVEVEGVKYQRLTDIQDPQIRRQVVGAAMEFIQFTGVLGEGVPPAPAPTERTSSWREDLRDSSQAELQRIHTPSASGVAVPQGDGASEQVEEQFLNLLTEMGQATPSGERPGMVSALQQRWAPKLPESESPRTFVDEIEAILQRRLSLIPALSGRDLHVRPGPGGSVLFGFEGREYETLDQVPNLTARQLIKDAIQEWDETT